MTKKKEIYNANGTIFGTVNNTSSKLSPAKYKKAQSEHYRKLAIGSLIFFMVCLVVGALWGAVINASTPNPDSRSLAGLFGPGIFIGIPAIISLIVAMVALVNQDNISRK